MSFAIRILIVGKPDALVAPVVERYLGLLRPFARVAIDHVKAGAPDSRADAAAVMREEGRRLLALRREAEHWVCLAAEGARYDSMGFSRWLEARRQQARAVVLVVGGAHGLDRRVKEACAQSLSLSALTLPHGLCLAVLAEQLYRAFTILKMHPYHK